MEIISFKPLAKKVCEGCHEEKLLGMFPIHKECTDGHSGTCNECVTKRQKASRNRTKLRPGFYN